RSLLARVYGIVVILGKPESRGRLRLASGDVRDVALIDPAYFSARADMETILQGVEWARRMADTPALVSWGNRELMPGKRARDRRQLEHFVRRNAMTTYHYAGTCQMGEGPCAVVDAELNVRGTQGLRVADASVMPVTPV